AGLLLASGVLVFVGGWLGWTTALWIGAAIAGLLALIELGLPERTVPPAPMAGVVRQLRLWFSQPRALGVMGFILFYKLGDAAMGPMVTPFWKHAGLTPTDVATVSATFGMFATIGGALVGGALTTRWGLLRGLWWLGLAQAGSNLGYAAAAFSGAG